MHPVVLSFLASLYLWAGSSAEHTSPEAFVSSFVEIGRTSIGRVLIDKDSVAMRRDESGGLIAGMLIKVQLKKPSNGAHTVINAAIFSCASESALVVSSSSLGKSGEVLSMTDHEQSIPWIRGSDNVTNVVMTQLCKGYKKLLKRGEYVV